jgi:hypothetical protein
MGSFKNLILQNNWASFNQTWHKLSLGQGDSHLFKGRDIPSPRGDNSGRVKILFSRSSRPKSIKIGTNYPLVKRIQVQIKARPSSNWR